MKLCHKCANCALCYDRTANSVYLLIIHRYMTQWTTAAFDDPEPAVFENASRFFGYILPNYFSLWQGVSLVWKMTLFSFCHWVGTRIWNSSSPTLILTLPIGPWLFTYYFVCCNWSQCTGLCG